MSDTDIFKVSRNLGVNFKVDEKWLRDYLSDDEVDLGPSDFPSTAGDNLDMSQIMNEIEEGSDDEDIPIIQANVSIFTRSFIEDMKKK